MSLPIEVDVETVKSLLKSNDFALIDCREQAEWDTARIVGAMLMPMSKWQECQNQLSELQGKRIAVHCHHGGRSLRVTRWLRENGFPDAQNMTGGIEAWSELIDPNVPKY